MAEAWMTKVGVVFPGQGSQYVGMAREILAEPDAAPKATDLFRRAEEITGLPLARLCLEGPEETLRQTDVTQPALLVASVAAWSLLEGPLMAHFEERPLLAAGHSLGEFSALVAAGAMQFDDACRLVRERGRLMAEAARQNPGAMAAVLGLAAEDVVNACRAAEEETGEVIQPANFNCPGQVVISGTSAGMAAASDKLRAAGARRIVPLAVSGAFHTRLLGGAAAEFSGLLNEVPLKQPRFPVVQNVTAVATDDPEQIRDNLRRQMASPVRWDEGLRQMAVAGVSVFVEVGPGKVLAGLVKKTLPDAVALNVEGLVDGKKALDFLEGGR